MSTSKTIRLFISSTFSDFTRERELLQSKVFPQIKDYANNLGYTFLPIDLKWGVMDQTLDQNILEISLNEVRECKKYMYPNFLIMLGDRYGWIPLPSALEACEFEELLLLTIIDSERKELEEWYEKDLNQLPQSYMLKKRTGKYEDYNEWDKIENSLRTILQEAVNKSNFTDNLKRKYFLSATEAEVEEGITSYNKLTNYQAELLSKDNLLMEVDPKHIFGLFRDIDKSTQIGNKFIGHDYEQAQMFKDRVCATLEYTNTLHVKTKQIDKETLEEQYLKEFENRMIEFLKSQIDFQYHNEAQNKLTPLEIELQDQYHFAIKKRKDYLGEYKLIQTIQDYISSNNQQSLVLYGELGRDKSALISKAIQEAEDLLTKKVIYRFISATQYSGSSKEILTSIFEELGTDVGSEQETFEEFSMHIFSEILNIKEDVVIFIDAIEQLQNYDQFLWLPNQLPQNVKIVISALNDVNYLYDSKHFQILQTKTNNIHKIPEFNEPIKLLTTLLEREGRTLQENQKAYFLKQFTYSKSPLYVTIATQIIKHWKSGDISQTLPTTQKSIIQVFIDNLSSFFNHNLVFVNKVLSYIHASRDGLSENELLQLLNTDKEFVNQMIEGGYHKIPTYELPLIHWSRLHMQLNPFLSLRTQDSEELMCFFHKEFEDFIGQQENQREQHEAIIKATQKLIIRNQDKDFYENRWGKLYIALITEYEIRYMDEDKQKEFALFIADSKILKDKWIEKCMSTISEIVFNHSKYNKMSKAIVHQETNLYAIKEFYYQRKLEVRN